MHSRPLAAIAVAGLILCGCASHQERQDADTVLHAVATEVQHITIFKAKVVKVNKAVAAEAEKLVAISSNDFSSVIHFTPAEQPSSDHVPAWFWPLPVATLAAGYYLGKRKTKGKK